VKKLKISFTIIFSLIFILSVAGYLLKPGPPASDYSEYLGPDFGNGFDWPPRYLRWKKDSRYITLSDGTRLAADVFLPADPVVPGEDNSRFPTILEYTPYNRAAALPGMKWWERIYLWWSLDLAEPIYDKSLSISARQFLARGYAYATVDMRGTGASFGRQTPLMPQLGIDGAEVVNWIASQQWSDGNVGMRGQSYLGWSQFATASNAPKALKCISPGLIVFDNYSEGIRPGGITAIRWLGEYSKYLQSYNLSRMDPDEGYYPAAPVLDEDGDGWLIDEIPLNGKGDSSLFTDDGPPVYADGDKRKSDSYYSAVLEHQENTLASRFMQEDVRYSDASFDVEGKPLGYLDTSPGAMLNKLIEHQIPVFHYGGWFDGFLKGTTKLHSSLQGKSPSRMIIGPRFHLPLDVTDPYKELFHYQGNLALDKSIEQTRFFDWCLRGEDNGIEYEPPVTIFVMNKGWRAESEWPLARQEIHSFHLDQDHALSPIAGSIGKDAYAVDFNHQSDYGSNQDDADVFVYLSDVDPDGQVRYVTEGQLRASFHKLSDPATQTGGNLEVRPELPWHGYRAEDQSVAPLADGKVVELNFDLMPTAWLFQAGHKIRISIAGADLDNFQLNPTLCPGGDKSSCADTRLQIHRGAETPSRIDLPVISKE
jgi:predicted acyl esterase